MQKRIISVINMCLNFRQKQQERISVEIIVFKLRICVV